MLEFLVNRIIKVDEITHGITLENELVINNFSLVYGQKKTNGLLLSIEQQKQNCYLISRFGDYVGYFSFNADLGFSLKLTDFENNFDKALDEYLELQKNNWKDEDILKYLKIADEIKKYSISSKMIISRQL
jgi:hypothetical protein